MVPSVASKTSQLDTRPALAIVIVNYNAWLDVARLVDALANAAEVHDGRCEVVVVDNASQGPIPPDFERPRTHVQLVARADNGGFAVGVNAGSRATRARWVLLLNPDVVAGPELPGRILERIQELESRPEGAPGVVGFALRNANGSRQPSVGADPSLLRCVREAFIPRSRRKYQPDRKTKPGAVPWVTGAFALIDSALLRETGGMDEDFFLYYEEVALCRTARKLGRRVEYDPRVEVVHLRPLQDRTVSPKLRVITRHSKLLYFRKHLPRWEFLGLSWVVSGESLIRGLACRLAGKREHTRAWATIAAIASAMRRGFEIRGTEVLAMAEVCSDLRRPSGPSETSRRPTEEARPTASQRSSRR